MVFFNPSLEAMNKEVLAWDLYDMISGHSMYSLQEIPIRFSSVDQYLDILEPLLLEECRAQILRSSPPRTRSSCTCPARSCACFFVRIVGAWMAASYVMCAHVASAGGAIDYDAPGARHVGAERDGQVPLAR